MISGESCDWLELVSLINPAFGVRMRGSKGILFFMLYGSLWAMIIVFMVLLGLSAILWTMIGLSVV